MPPSLIDIGVNLGHRSFHADRDAVLARAAAAGVSPLIVTGTSERGSREALALCQAHPGVLYCTAGVHPHDARSFTPGTAAVLRDLAGSPAVVAIGECGLDFNRDFSPRPQQEHAFEAQIDLAATLGKPLFLHERDAHDRFVAILGPHIGRLRGAVVHCFAGTAAELRAYLDLGLHIGITGWICDERRGLELRQIVRQVPVDRLMLETDAPFLTPRDLRPQPPRGRNEPALLPHVLRRVASCLDQPEAHVAAATTATARRFFALP